MLSLMPGLWLSLVCALPTEARYLRGRLEMVISGGLCSQVSATLEIRLTLLAMRAVCVCMTMALSLAWLFLSFVSHPHQSLFVSLLCMYLTWPQTPASASPRLLHYKHAPPCSAPQGVLLLLWVGPPMLPNLQGSAQALPPPLPSCLFCFHPLFPSSLPPLPSALWF